VILTTHHLEEVQVCDRLCLMLAGRLHFEGTPGGMVEAFPGPVLLVSADQVKNVHQILKREYGASPLGDRVRIQRPGVDPRQVVRVLENAGITGVRVEAVQPTLEDAFVRAAADLAPSDPVAA